MQQMLKRVPRVAFFLAVAAGAITSSRRKRAVADPPALDELKRSLEAMGERLADQEAKQTQRLTIIEDRVNDQSMIRFPRTRIRLILSGSRCGGGRRRHGLSGALTRQN